ncbi:MAG: tetratricopeptide repeat protein, partial [Verrucomicrobiota bacterium]
MSDDDLFSESPHREPVTQLQEQGDWAGLIRYWMAHGLAPDESREAARKILGGFARKEEAWRPLHESVETFLGAPTDPSWEPPEELPDLSQSEKVTLVIVQLFPRMALCEMAGQFPPEQQSQLYQMGFQAAEQVKKLGNAIGDLPLVVFSCAMQARGFQECRQLERSREAYEEALEKYRELARKRPEVYEPDVAMTLNNLGNVLSDLSELERSREAYEEAVHLYERAGEREERALLPERQRALQNLGLILRNPELPGGMDLLRAKENFERARLLTERIRGTFFDLEQRKRIQQEAVGIYQGLLATYLDLYEEGGRGEISHLQKAVEVAEASRCRGLIDLLVGEELRPEGVDATLVDEFFSLRERLQSAQAALDAEERRQPGGGAAGESGADADG